MTGRVCRARNRSEFVTVADVYVRYAPHWSVGQIERLEAEFEPFALGDWELLEKREIEIPTELQKELGTKLTQRLNGLSFTHKKEFVVWYSEAKKEDTRARRVEKMKQMLSAGKVIS